MLQVGDIHFSENKNKFLADYKDNEIPKEFVNQIAPNALTTVLKKMLDLVGDYKINGVLFCGDLTTAGNLEEYKKCIEFLHDSFLNPKKFTENQIHVVPGNHDVDRDKCDRTGKDLKSKFKPLQQAWEEKALQVLKYRNQDIVNEKGDKVCIYSMNSCIGCGVTRNFPKEIEAVIFNCITKLHKKKKMKKERYNELRYQTLDTPAFLQDELDKIDSDIQSLDRTSLPIILAHHNILPQFTPRISVYGELLNGGVLRSSLVNKDKIILFCHGHIHENPVEIVAAPDQNSKMVCISAPELISGFNVIHIEYNSMNIPLGCIVEKCKMERGKLEFNKVKIPFYGINHIGDISHENTRKVFNKSTKNFQRFDEIYNLLDGNITKKNIASSLLELEWFGVVEIHNKEIKPKEWQIARRF